MKVEIASRQLGSLGNPVRLQIYQEVSNIADKTNPAGIITTVVGVGSTTGTWRHFLRYRPLSPDSQVA